MPLAHRPVTTSVAGDRIPVNAAAEGLLPGRRLIIRGSRASDRQTVVVQATLVAAHKVDASARELEITPPLADAADARQRRGPRQCRARPRMAKRVTQVLGAGNASTSFQRFELKQLPLTYRAAANEIGATAALTVRVNDIAWSEQPTLFGAGPADRAYTLETDEQGRDVRCFRRWRARRAPAERRQQCARGLPQGAGQRRQCRRRQLDAADDAARSG